MNKTLKRIIITTKDIQILTGRSYPYALKVMNEIRKQKQKQRHQLISIFELCDHLSLPLNESISQLSLDK